MTVAQRPPGPLSALGLSVILAVMVIDQLAKLAAEAWLPFGQPIEILPFLSLMRTYNSGIAFSLLDSLGSPALIAVVAVITGVVLTFWTRARDGGWLAGIGYALIVGGALGNFIDRVRFGHVVDYFYLHFGAWGLFVFNLADAALTCGPIVLIASIVFAPRRQEQS